MIKSWKEKIQLEDFIMALDKRAIHVLETHMVYTYNNRMF